MSYLRHIEENNRVDWRKYRPVLAEGVVVGRVDTTMAGILAGFPAIFQVAGDAVRLEPSLETFEQRTAAIRSVCERLIEQGVLREFHGELYGAFDRPGGRCFFAMDRRHVIPFGVLSAGVHVNGLVGTGPDRMMWIARRSRTKATYPGQLDNIVAGGKPYDETPAAVMLRECQEEAGIPGEIARTAASVSVITYATEMPEGLRYDVVWNFDLTLPEEFEPVPEDGEVDAFMLMPLEEVAAIVRETGRFKFNCNLVVIDYLIRTGFITPEEPDYVALATGLHGWQP